MRLFKGIIIRIKRGNVLSFISKNVLYLLLRTLFWTYRLEVKYVGGGQQSMNNIQGLCYFWHQHIISGMFFFFKLKARGACIVSPSNDGKMAGFICQKLGFEVLYGSSHKSSVSVTRQALSELNHVGRLCLVGDGSRGPAFQLQRGVVYLAEKTGKPLIFIECTAPHAITFKKSWDQFKVPLPFSKIFVTVHQPQFVTSDPSDVR